MREGMENAKVCTVNDVSELNELTADATVTCSRCGMRSHDAKNLCSPVSDT